MLYHIYNGIKKIGKKRANEINIQDKLLKGENIWNLCIINNINFWEETFGYDNIFDVTKHIMHATLRMYFSLNYLI